MSFFTSVRNRVPLACACMLALAVGRLMAGSSETLSVCIDSESSLLWKTITSPSANVSLMWPKGAVKARVLMDGSVIAATADTGAVDLPLVFPLPADASGEKVVVLTAEYLDSSDAVVSSQSVSLGLVAGTQPGDAIPVVPQAVAKSWNVTRNPQAVLPVPEGAATISVDAAATGVSAPGWFFWSGYAAGIHTLALAGDDIVGSAQIEYRPYGGFKILFR